MVPGPADDASEATPSEPAADGPAAEEVDEDLRSQLSDEVNEGDGHGTVSEAEADARDDWPDDPEATKAFLEAAYAALVAEGFKGTPFQYRKKGQAFGVIKDHGHELQLHVRAFTNGVIESEVELSNRYVEHLVSPRRSCHAEIKAIFEKHGVATETINEEFRTRTGADRNKMPVTRTKTSDLVKGAVGVAGAIGAVAFARFVRRGRSSK